MSDLDLSRSYGRCLLDPQFLDRFYDRFIASSPAVAERFAKTDMARQKDMMRSSLSMLVMFDKGKPIARPTLDQLRVSHGPGRYAIPRQMYEDWLECLLVSVRESDRQLTPELEARWREAMTKGIAYMTGS
ncbi:MAG TPA: globin [Myxococcaceae bacterium]|nr:globin [Myxococcaceae bacterium]